MHPRISGSKLAAITPTLLLALAAAFAGPAVAQLRVVELAVESTGAGVVLPSGPGSTLVLTPCTGCSPMSLSATPATRYAIGGVPVSLPELRRWLRTHRNADVVVLYTRDSNTLTRVLASAR